MKKTAFILGGIMLLGGAAYGASKIIKPNDDKNEIIIKKDAEIEDLQNKLASANAKIIALENALQTLQQKYDNLESSSALEKTELLAQINALKNELLEEQEAKALLETQLQDALAQIASGQKVFEFYEDLSIGKLSFNKFENGTVEIGGIRHATYAFEISRYRPSLPGFAYEEVASDKYNINNGVVTFDKDFILSEFEDSKSTQSLRLAAKAYYESEGVKYSWPISTNYLLLNYDEYAVLEQLDAPIVTNIDYVNQLLSFKEVDNAKAYAIAVDNVIYAERLSYVSPTKLSGLPINDGSVVGIKATAGFNSKFADSKFSEVTIKFLEFQKPTLTLDGTIITISDIDPIAVQMGEIYIEGLMGRLYFNVPLSDFVGGKYDVRDAFLSQNDLLEKDEIYQISLSIKGQRYYKNSAAEIVEITYDFYEDLEQHTAPEFISFNQETGIIKFKLYKDFDNVFNEQHIHFFDFYLKNKDDEIFKLSHNGTVIISINDDFVILEERIDSQRVVINDSYKIGVEAYTYNLGFEKSDISFSENFYSVEFKEVVAPELSIVDNVLSFESNDALNYWLGVFYRGTSNRLEEFFIEIKDGYINLSDLNIPEGFYDIRVSAGRNAGYYDYAMMGAVTKAFEYDVL